MHRILLKGASCNEKSQPETPTTVCSPSTRALVAVGDVTFEEMGADAGEAGAGCVVVVAAVRAALQVEAWSPCWVH